MVLSDIDERTSKMCAVLSRTELVVLTGDIIGSSRFEPTDLDIAMEALKRASCEVMRHWGYGYSRFIRGRSEPDQSSVGSEDARFTRFRGDGWQCIGPTPEHSLRAALVFRAHLSALGRPFDTRISVGIGSGFLSPEPNLAGAGGPAFELSGRGLDRMAHAARFAVSWAEPPEGAELIQALFGLCDEISRKWTPAQANVFIGVLGPVQRPSQEALAGKLDITQQVVARHLTGGGDWALRQALDALEKAA